MSNITACIICKNEEQHIGACIRALKKYDIPIVITDTGSTDRTIAIVRPLLAERDKLCHFTMTFPLHGTSAAGRRILTGSGWSMRMSSCKAAIQLPCFLL